MLCPSCKAELKMADRQGIEIDYCPGCRGVWLDRGELDKIVERSGAQDEARSGFDEQAPEPRERRYREDDSDPDFRRGQPRRKKSLWGELFDF